MISIPIEAKMAGSGIIFGRWLCCSARCSRCLFVVCLFSFSPRWFLFPLSSFLFVFVLLHVKQLQQLNRSTHPPGKRLHQHHNTTTTQPPMYRRSRSAGSGPLLTQFRPPRMASPALKGGEHGITLVQGQGQGQGQGQTEAKQEQRRVASVPPLERKRQKVDSNGGQDHVRYFEVVWRKQTMRKNKTWDGDGVVVLYPAKLSLRLDESANFKEKLQSLNVGKFTTDGVFALGSIEIEVMGEIEDTVMIEKIKGKPTGEEEKELKPKRPKPPASLPSPAMRKHQISLNRQFKQVIPATMDPDQTNKQNKSQPLYDPSSPNAIVMAKKSKEDVDVVIDPFLSKQLRPHQVKGVKFMYECVMGLKNDDITGALLADDMGLGKTLQTITLIWTLLKQSAEGLETPAVKKVLVACPVTLVANWKREFKKWLPMNRLGVLTLHSKNTVLKDKQDIKNFARTKVYQVLVMGYEKILNMKDELALTKFDLLICDEGHRLKNNSNKTLHALNSLEIQKKVLLSGTPIQNDLTEFFNIIDFINPGILGTFNQFKRNYINPIIKSRELNLMNKQLVAKGEEKSQDLIDITKPFILRRTASVIQNHLPPRTDIVLFCPPTSLQINLFSEVLQSHAFQKLVTSASNAGTLGLITMFKKICNSPSLMTSDSTFKEYSHNNFSNQVTSGKIQVLIELLIQISAKNEKVVVVSNYTQTLDIIQNVLGKLNLTYLRLDGSTPSKERDSIVSQFNNSQARAKFAFLLSSKSGGVGLNLIGASRLILFDNDWNPSVDLQAMARIHRDGQKRPVFIYRLITTGCIDEKIFQRQLMKSNLSDKFLDKKSSSKDDLFDMSDLKDLFNVQKNTKCNTHDLIDCGCEGAGDEFGDDDDEEEDGGEDGDVEIKKEKAWVSALEYKNKSVDGTTEERKKMRKCLNGFKHIDPLKSDAIPAIGDECTENIVMENNKVISYILTKVNKPID